MGVSALRVGFVLYDSTFTAYGGEKALIWVFDNYTLPGVFCLAGWVCAVR